MLKIMNFFVVWLTAERRLALFPTGTIVKVSFNIMTIVGVIFSTVATLLRDLADNKIYKKHQVTMKVCFLSLKYA